jgi:hypothetical protein
MNYPKSYHPLNSVKKIFINSVLDDITRCLNKATIINCRDNMILVADDKYIYYWGAIESKRKTKEFYAFYQENLDNLNNKLFYANEENLPTNKYELMKENEDTKINLYRFVV